MIRILKYPATNVTCISLFTAFYAMLFLTSTFSAVHEGNAALRGWSALLAAGGQSYLAYVLIALTVVVVVLLLLRRRPYDEYQTAHLANCIFVAFVLTVLAIALFCMLMLLDASAVREKFMMFAALHWGTVVLADLVFVLRYGKSA